MNDTMQFDELIVIGRFQPLQKVHCARIARALSVARRIVVLVGSAHRPRTARNPFTAEERAAMIQASVATEAERLLVAPLRDRLYDESAWVAEVHSSVRAFGVAQAGHRVGFMPAEAANIDRYEQLFPDWELVRPADAAGISPFALRDTFFSDAGAGSQDGVSAHVPAPVYSMMERFRATPAYQALLEEHRHLVEYKRSWSSAPYPPIFVTADAVLVHSKHVLLIRRGHPPGRGAWALPGGFVDQQELLLDAALRELQEETQLSVSESVLKRALIAREVFDYPERSARGRTITHAFCFHIPNGERPAVRGSDDAAQAEWIPMAHLPDLEAEFFEDHFHILDYFLRTCFERGDEG